MKKELLLNNKENYVCLLAPSFVAEFSYPDILFHLKNLGFAKIVELTFGAKMINREYHRILRKSKAFFISTVCPGIVETINNEYPQFKNNFIPVDSPMIATAKLCRKIYPKYKIVFIAPCNFKKIEATQKENKKYIDYILDYQELRKLFFTKRINPEKKISEKQRKQEHHFDKFYNDYTKIYPLAGGLSKTAHLKGVLRPGDEKIIDGITEVKKFLEKPDKNTRFLDANFCIGGCIGGPCLSKNISLAKKRKKVLDYLELAKREKIPRADKGNIKKVDSINFIK